MLRALPMELTQIVEALLFSCQEPLSVADMCRAVKETAKDIVEGGEADDSVKALNETSEEQINASIQQLIEHYDKDGRSFTLVERSTGWRLCARGEFAEWCRALFPGKKPQRLSQPALETLAIIAYRQPITRGGMEAVRGVSVDAMVQQLLDRGLIKIEGRADLPGRPLLYGTTDLFLEHFGVRTVDELPNATELRRIKLPAAETEQPGGGDAKPEQQLFLDPQADDATVPSSDATAEPADAAAATES
jgi:segregation and condensation protein B